MKRLICGPLVHPVAGSDHLKELKYLPGVGSAERPQKKKMQLGTRMRGRKDVRKKRKKETLAEASETKYLQIP